MIGVRNYGFPGFFNEANPESSTRNTGTRLPRRIWFAPGYVEPMIPGGGSPAARLSAQTSSSSLRIWNARTMSVTPCISAQMPAKTSST